jgi:hypothetical protein
VQGRPDPHRGDRPRKQPLGGELLDLRAETWAARGDPEMEERVLDWRFGPGA